MTATTHPAGRLDALAPAEVARRLGSDLLRGLSAEEAARRLADEGPNQLPPPERTPWTRRFLSLLREPMTILLLVAALISGVALGERVDAVAILAIVVLNTVIALVEEGRAERTLDALRELQTPLARVVRDGVVLERPSPELVPGDLVLLQAGDRVPADARLTRAVMLEIDESLLTGESTVVDKAVTAGGGAAGGVLDRPSMLFAGTFVTRGSGAGIVAATGANTELGQIAGQLAGPRHPTPLQRDLARVTGQLGGAAVAIASAVFLLTLVRAGTTGGGLEQAFLSAVALAVAAVPEGLATVTLVALAVGVRRMASRGAIIRRLPAVETLGATSVIVTDKTGTLTQNQMRLAVVAFADRPFSPVEELPAERAARVHEVGVLCSEATLDPPVGDPMEVALLEAAGADQVARLRAARPRLAALPFDAERRRMAVLHDGVAGLELFVKGAPEAVIPLCATAMTADETVRSLDPTEADRLLAAAETAALEGVRVLAVARRTFGPAAQVPTLETAERDLTFEALVGLRDPIRPEARAAVDEAGGAGIRILMATGDHPGTASAVAREVGLCAPDCRPVTGGELRLRGVPEDPLATAVYARVEPEQKLDLVEALQRRGLVVAMTGDGVNDAPALHTADIGVALGARGSDVAREAADMVISDDNLATIVVAVREGRGIYDNIRKVIDYLIAGNLSEISVVVAALLLFPGLGVPLLPVQLLWVNLLTDGLPAIALGLDRAHPTLMADPPRRREAQLLGPRRVGLLAARGAAIAAACIAALALDLAWGQPVEHARTVLFTTLVTAHMAYAFVARRRPTRVKGREPGIGGWFGTPLLVAAVGGGLALQWVIVTWPAAHGVFGTVALDARDWALVVAAALAGVAGTIAVPRPLTPASLGPATDPPTGPAAGETRAA